MKIPTSKALIFLSLVGLLLGVAHSWESTDLDESPPFSEVFPSWNDVKSMAHLSHLVYDFKSVADFTCANFTDFASANCKKHSPSTATLPAELNMVVVTVHAFLQVSCTPRLNNYVLVLRDALLYRRSLLALMCV